MRHRHESDLERSRLDLFRPRGNVDHLIQILPVLFHFGAGHRGGEAAGINRRVQHAVQVTDGPDVVLVRVGYENPVQTVGTVCDIGRIGKDQIDAGRCLHIRKSNARVDKDEPFLVFGPIAVKIHIHADFPRPTERQENQSFF